MSLISRRQRNVALWLGFGALMSPLGFNCHSQTDQSAAVSQQSVERREDDADQTVRAMASVQGNRAPSVQPDGAPLTESKVRLGSTVSSLAGGASKGEPVIAKGTPLLALYDNECRAKAGLKTNTDLKFEAGDITPQDDVSLSTLTEQANSDPCLVRVDENRVMQFVAPISDTTRGVVKSQSDEVSAQAIANDPRVSEARQIIFSKALQAWDWFYSDTGLKSDVIVAVVDTGVLYTHPDLADNIYTDSNGHHGYDFANNDDDPLDDYGHGTHVAGIIGARANNGIGVTGVIGTRVKIMAVKVLAADGSGSFSNIVNGIRYAADQGASVINLSLGGKGTSTAVRDAVSYAVGKGVVVLIAAGNDGVLMDASNNFYSPSGYAKDIPGTLAIGSVDSSTGARSSFSNYSTTYVQLAAPGSNGILSTYLNNTYQVLQGTSMATPVVAGAAALLIGSYRAHGISYVPSDITGLLTESARPVTALNSEIRSGATLDIERAAKLFFSRYVMAGNGGTEVQ